MEEWRDIPTYKGVYQASNLGRIRRVDKTKHGGVLSLALCGRYLKAHLSMNGKKKMVSVHRLVALAFHGIPSEGQQINHKSGNKLVNTPQNLEWVSMRRNIDHAFATGLRSSTGTSNPKAKLTEYQVTLMRRLATINIKIATIARLFNIGYLAAYRAITGKRWTHI